MDSTSKSSRRTVEEVSEEGLEGEGETTEDGESSDSDSDGGEETSE